MASPWPPIGLAGPACHAQRPSSAQEVCNSRARQQRKGAHREENQGKARSAAWVVSPQPRAPAQRAACRERGSPPVGPAPLPAEQSGHAPASGWLVLARPAGCAGGRSGGRDAHISTQLWVCCWEPQRQGWAENDGDDSLKRFTMLPRAPATLTRATYTLCSRMQRLLLMLSLLKRPVLAWDPFKGYNTPPLPSLHPRPKHKVPPPAPLR